MLLGDLATAYGRSALVSRPRKKSLDVVSTDAGAEEFGDGCDARAALKNAVSTEAGADDEGCDDGLEGTALRRVSADASPAGHRRPSRLKKREPKKQTWMKGALFLLGRTDSFQRA